MHADARRAGERLDDAHELGRPEAALVLHEPRREVEHAERAVGRLEARLEDVGVRQIALRAELDRSAGAMENRPPSRRRAAPPKTGGESKRGMHDHTIAPSRRRARRAGSCR